MEDTTRISYVAEDLITHHLQRANLLVAKPKSDQLGTDLLVLDRIADGVKFCRVQCKGRNVSKQSSSVKIPKEYVTPAFVLFLFVERDTGDGSLYYFLANAIRSWKRNAKDEFVLRVPQNHEALLAPWRFSGEAIERIRAVINTAEAKGEFDFLVFGSLHARLGDVTAAASGTVSS